MPVDPMHPDTYDEDGTGAVELDAEVPEADAAEQHTDLAPQGDDVLARVDLDVANEADAVEQARVVAIDEDDYR
ncbi:hypothetical protein ABIA35_008422 [Catenulispora sp. MAP12-49]|uniref:hypothetical protein n=1 Tax=Catenulispora sp. MAP12-49 TaxID=3156302 RepID=UPI0035192C06